jgi:uncharacterized membrane protein YukC
MMAWGFLIFCASAGLAQFTEVPKSGHCPIRTTLGLGLIIGAVLMLASASFYLFGSMP